MQAKHEAELSNFEIEGTPPDGSVSLRHLESILGRAERVLALATSLASDSAWQEWQHMPPDLQALESELRNAIARRLEVAANGASTGGADADLSSALARWTETIQRLSLQGSRIALISQISNEAQHLGFQPEGELVHNPRNSPALNPC